MPQPKIPDEVLADTAASYEVNDRNQSATAAALGIARQTLQNRLRRAAERGMLGSKPVLPGFRISQTTSTPNGDFVQQKPERGEQFEVPAGHKLKGVSSLVDADGRTIIEWRKTTEDSAHQEAAAKAALAGFLDQIPRAEPVAAPSETLPDMLAQYTITDHHMGALAWNEETGGGDYDLAIGEKLLVDWFDLAISCTPPTKRAVLAQLGDFLHYDSFKSITPEHGNLLDGDTRFPKMVRAAIRSMRAIISKLLVKHEQLDVIIADANHDPAGAAWMREMFASFLENEPRVRIDRNPGTYSFIEHGSVSLFFHHGHRRKPSNVDSVFVGRFREVYGRTRYSYAHLGHKHQDDLLTTNLMKVEQHETLAAPDAYAANGGWLSGRSAKVILYHAKYGEQGRQTYNAEMVSDFALRAANDNASAAQEEAA